MTPERWTGVVVLCFGLVVGAFWGQHSYGEISDRRPVCGTCHHDQTRLEQRADTAPHDTEFSAKCHNCHVLPLREYSEALANRLGFSAPSAFTGITNPNLGGQTCLACHVSRGRGAITCERCHVDGSAEVALGENCVACHDEHPNPPHGAQPCRDCHVGAALDHTHRTHSLMQQKLEHP